MNRRDGAILAALVLVLVVLGGAIALPQARPGSPEAAAEPTPAATLPPVTYREGMVGSPVSITPITARTRADRALVGLVFSGLVRPDPAGGYEPDLAESWTSDAEGTTWTVTIRPDATWQDGAPVTAADVVYTVEALKNPDAAGGAAASWAEVTATAIGPRTVQFSLATPLGGFLAALCQPLLPAHLLADVPFADLAESDFARLPVGTGPFALVELDGTRAVLEPAAPVRAPVEPTPGPTLNSLATPYPTPTTGRPVPYLERIEMSFFDTEEALATALRTGEIDGAAGFTPAVAGELAATEGTERLRYPTTTLSAVMLNLRPSHPELRDAAVRRALLASIDRDALVAGPLAGDAVRADALVPPGSWAFDATAGSAVGVRPEEGLQGADRCRLDQVGWQMGRAQDQGRLQARGPHGARHGQPAPGFRGGLRPRCLGQARVRGEPRRAPGGRPRHPAAGRGVRGGRGGRRHRAWSRTCTRSSRRPRSGRRARTSAATRILPWTSSSRPHGLPARPRSARPRGRPC